MMKHLNSLADAHMLLPCSLFYLDVVILLSLDQLAINDITIHTCGF